MSDLHARDQLGTLAALVVRLWRELREADSAWADRIAMEMIISREKGLAEASVNPPEALAYPIRQDHTHGMPKTRRFERLDERLAYRTPDQTREVTRRLRPDLWPVDGVGGGRASQEVPVWAVVNRMLSVGSQTVTGTSTYVLTISQAKFSMTQHEQVPAGSGVDRLLGKLAVAEPTDRRTAGSFIRGADMTLQEVFTQLLAAFADPEIADLADSLGMELEFVNGPPPFQHVAVIWLYEAGQRYGWTYQPRAKSQRSVVRETPTRVMVRSTKMPSAWFAEYSALLNEQQKK